MAISAGIGAVGSIAGGFLGSRGASSAANAQVRAANAASDVQRSMFDATREDMNRFKYQGYNASNWLGTFTGVDNGTGTTNGVHPADSLLLSSAPQYQRYADFTGTPYTRFPGYEKFEPTMQQLEQTPGYRFALDQGLKSVTNKLAAAGLSGSGPQARALMDYATGKASQTYQQQFQNNLAEYETGLKSNIEQFNTAANNNRADYTTGLGAWTNQFNTGFNAFTQNQNNIWNKLYSLIGLGQNSAAQTGTIGAQVGGQIGQNMIGAGNAAAAGTVGSTNALTGAITGGINQISTPFLYNRLMGAAGSPGGSFNGSANAGAVYGAGGYFGEGPFVGAGNWG